MTVMTAQQQHFEPAMRPVAQDDHGRGIAYRYRGMRMGRLTHIR